MKFLLGLLALPALGCGPDQGATAVHSQCVSVMNATPTSRGLTGYRNVCWADMPNGDRCYYHLGSHQTLSCVR